MIRRTTHFSGRVQGVGFRYTATHVARGYRVSGYVRNLPDGRVEVVAEGQAEEISRFLAEIGREMEGKIRKQTDDDSPATGEFSDFGVRR